MYCSPASAFASAQTIGGRTAPPPAAAIITLPHDLNYTSPPTAAATAYYMVSVELQQPVRPHGSSTSSTSEPSSTTSTVGTSGSRFVAPPTLEGLELGPAIAAGYFGRVFRGKYRGQVVSRGAAG